MGATSVVNRKDKEKYVYSGYGIVLDSAGSWSFDNDIARKVKIFGVDNHHLMLTIARVTL